MGANQDINSYNLYNYCSNNPISNVDSTGKFLSKVLKFFFKKAVETVTKAVKKAKKRAKNNIVQKTTKKSSKKNNPGHNKLPSLGSPGGYATTPNGEIERWYGENGRPRLDRHHTDHGNPKNHPYVPHDHEWSEDENGNWRPGKGYPTLGVNDNATKVIAGVTISYLVYRGGKIALAWLLSPVTGGWSWVYAFAP